MVLLPLSPLFLFADFVGLTSAADVGVEDVTKAGWEGVVGVGG